VPMPLYPQHKGEREWMPWLVPSILVTNIVIFVIAVNYNNCPAHTKAHGVCVPGHGRWRRGDRLLRCSRVGEKLSSSEKRCCRGIGRSIWVGSVRVYHVLGIFGSLKL
jgi:hypothetical protein